jgi:hypothetical protein
MQRTEQEIFEELAALCIAPGFGHALAYLCTRDNVIRYSREMKAADLQHLSSMERLSRTEMSTLIGLMAKAPLSLAVPDPKTLQHYISRADALLSEMHHAMVQDVYRPHEWMKLAKEGDSPFANGAAMREAIFYGSESAYSFQYRDLSVLKYAADDDWLERNKGFTISVARDVVRSIGQLHNDKLLACQEGVHRVPTDELTLLPAYTYTVQEISDHCSVPLMAVEHVLRAFTFPPGEFNEGFRTLHDFNLTNALPLLRTEADSLILFQPYSLLEALYESPFYWMAADRVYMPIAMTNRGEFTEEFARDRLELVFGKDRVWTNVDIVDTTNRKVGEIDVLVVFSDRAIVLQAKSKRLTLEARKGNDLQLKDDFKKSVQDSYDQGYSCASLLSDTRYKLIARREGEISIPRTYKEIYILCVVADHYPALTFQARQFLRYNKTDVIQPPFVLDVFALDVITEMLPTPLRFLSYINRRTGYHEQVLSVDELTILSYHLQTNLWVGDEYNMLVLDGGIAADLDVAMAVRRDGVSGRHTPEGILTHIAGTPVGRLVEDLEANGDLGTLDLGFLLLMLGEDSIVALNEALRRLADLARRDGKTHDLTFLLGVADSGLTIHCTADREDITGPALQQHCRLRKYAAKAMNWYGLCVDPDSMRMRFGFALAGPWVRDPSLDEAADGLAEAKTLISTMRELRRKNKVGRNEPCPCGSRRKYKKCCLH